MADELKKGMVSRGIVKKYTAWFVFGAIILVFVFFGFSSRMSHLSVGSAARVNDSFISVADYLSEETRIQQYYSNMFGGKLDMGMQRQFVRSQAIESLVYGELSSQAAQKEGLNTSDLEVRDYILTKMTFLQKDGRFQKEYYDRYLEIIHSTPAEFENKVRKEIKNTRARQLIEAAFVPMSLEEKKTQELKARKINLAYAHFDQEAMIQQMTIPDVEINAALAKADFKKKAEDYFAVHRAEFKGKGSIKDPKAATEPKANKDGKSDPVDKTEVTEVAWDDVKVQVVKKLLAQEKVDAGIQNLEKALNEKNENAIDIQLKGLNIKWEETGFFDFTVDAIPKIASAQALDGAFELSTQQPLLGRMIREGNQRYILKLKESKTEAFENAATASSTEGTDKSTGELTNRRRADAIYANWIENFKKVSRVEVNNELIKQ